MADVPESMRKRTQRKISAEASRETSEDGDFVTLRAVREKHAQHRANKKKLPKITESKKEENNNAKEDDPETKQRKESRDSGIENGSSPETPSKELLSKRRKSERPFSPSSDKRFESLRLSLFSAVKEGNTSSVEEQIRSIETKVSISDDKMRAPDNGMNILHLALDNNKMQVATSIINMCDNDVMKQVFYLPQGKGPRTALHQITLIGDLQLAKLLLYKLNSDAERQDLIKKNTEVQVKGQRPRSLSAFHLAAFEGHSSLVKMYLEIGVEINLANDKGDSALLWAARWGHNDTVKCLLDREADVHKNNDKDSTALHWAVRYEHVDTVTLLLEEGNANANQKRKIGLVTPLILASALGNENIVSTLLQNNADVNLAIRGQETPLHHAAKEGHLSVVNILLKHGADLKAKNEKGDSAVILAATHGHSDVVEKLVEAGSDINHRNHVGQDTWYHAMMADDEEVLKVLAEHYLSRYDEQNSLTSPICIAASMGMADKLKFLIDYGIDPLATDVEENSFLHYAALHNRAEIIVKFHKKGDINAQNRRRETPLHLACAKGNAEAALALMNNKAKSNVENEDKQTALHVAALSEYSSPELARAVVQHTIKSHDWESVNAIENQQQNALHLAAQFAKPDVLWEFRYIRLKDKDNDENTPLHDSVRPNDPEPLETVLDIYENMSRDADINEQNRKKESILHLAGSAGFADTVSRLIFLGADLACQDKNKNTVLHRLVELSVSDSENCQMYMKVVDVILHDCVRWWCTARIHKSYPSDDKTRFYLYRRQAILCLVEDVYNCEGLSVIGLASRVGADTFLSKIMTLEGVMCFEENEKLYFDVTHMTPSTNYSVQKCCGSNRVSHALSYVELLIALDIKQRAARVLNIPPIRQVERMYTAICAWAYAFFMILHILYMALFTYFGITISAEFRNVTNTDITEPIFIASYVIVPLEPIIYIIFAFDMMLRVVKRRELPTAIESLNLFCALGFTALTIAWLVLIGMKNTDQDYLLSICLCLGWLFSISYTRGFKRIHFFYRMLLNIFIEDVFRFLIVYVFVLLAFGFALHVLFQISSVLIQTYETPLGTFFMVFNLMIGMGELFDDAYESAMTDVGRTDTFSKFIYLVYVVFGTIVLLNLLIAMMNDSYSEILSKRKVTWRVDSVEIGVGIENMFPWSPAVFGGVTIKSQHVTDLGHDRWFLITDEAIIKKYSIAPSSDGPEVYRQVLDKRITDIENRVQHIEKVAQNTVNQFDSILKILQGMEKSKPPKV